MVAALIRDLIWFKRINGPAGWVNLPEDPIAYQLDWKVTLPLIRCLDCLGQDEVDTLG